MIKKIQKILSFKSASHNKSFLLQCENDKNNSTYETYYANIEQSIDSKNNFYNKNCLININDNNIDKTQTLYTSLYSLSSIYVKSALYNKTVDSSVPDSRNFQNIYNYKKSDSEIINQIAVEDIIYELNTPTTYGKETLLSDVYFWHTTNYQSSLPCVDLSTVILCSDNTAASYYLSDITDISQLSVNEKYTQMLSSLKYNQIFEIPGYVYNDYDSGCFAVNVYKTKNELNSKYNMYHSKDGNIDLFNARTYVKIDHCNDQLYLTYYDNAQVQNNNYEETSSCLNGYNYQKVEVITGFNRYEHMNSHKTNYYDVDIICEKLFNSLTSNNIEVQNKISNIKKNLKLEIANMVTDICKQLSPVDTQLIQVNVLESEFEV